VSNPSKQKGTSWETSIVNWLASHGVSARRKPLAGNKDEGDLVIEAVPWIAIEAKNCKAMALAQWVDEADKEAVNSGADVGVVWHHRYRKGSPGEGYVTMSGQAFLNLMYRAGMLEADH
jgi:hypothetical protein